MDPPDFVQWDHRPEPLFDPDDRDFERRQASGAELQCLSTRIISPGKPGSGLAHAFGVKNPIRACILLFHVSMRA
jgi:hypothetical protein